MNRKRRLSSASRICASLALLISAVCYGQVQMPRFTQLSASDAARLDQQRAVVAAAARKRYGTPGLKKNIGDLKVLQRLIDDKAFAKNQTYELQCLGVAFGDVLASELPLRWVMVTDEFGTDPTLRFKNTSTNVNALTMISKRIETDRPVSLTDLLAQTRSHLNGAQE